MIGKEKHLVKSIERCKVKDLKTQQGQSQELGQNEKIGYCYCGYGGVFNVARG
jgi:hypothetical protein